MGRRRTGKRGHSQPAKVDATVEYLARSRRSADQLIRIIDRDAFQKGNALLLDPAWPDWAVITAAGLARTRYLLAAMVAASKRSDTEPVVPIVSRTVAETFILSAFATLYEVEGLEKLARADHAQCVKSRATLGQEPPEWDPKKTWAQTTPTWSKDRLRTTNICDDATTRAQERNAKGLAVALEGAKIAFQNESEQTTHGLFALLRAHRGSMPPGMPLGGAPMAGGGALPNDFTLPVAARLITADSGVNEPSFVAWRLHYSRDFVWWLCSILSINFRLDHQKLNDLLDESRGGLNLVQSGSALALKARQPSSEG